MSQFPSISTDQMATLVELARQGSLRAAAEVLHISEQGARNRLVALEERLGVELYRKRRGVRVTSPLTEEGQRLLPHAIQFLDRASQLGELFNDSGEPSQVHVVASQYLIAYELLDVVRRFHAAEPKIKIRLSARLEQEIDEELRSNPLITLGVAAPYEASPELDYQHLLSLDWSLITPRRHRLLKKDKIQLSDMADQPMILYERGSTGRAHVVEAFRKRKLSLQVELEASNTDLIVRMVEAGLGIAIVPLHPSGAVTRGRAVGIKPLRHQIRAIDSGILTRKLESLSPAAKRFVDFVSSR